MANAHYQIISQPLKSCEFVSILRLFRNLMNSSVGARCKLKILVTGAGHSVITSSSSRLLNYLPINDPICLFICQVMKSQLSMFGDYGLYTGVLTSSLLIHALSQTMIPTSLGSSLIQQFSCEIINHVNANRIKIDFSTVKHLLPIVRTILCSKPACGLTKSNIDSITIFIVKAFLCSVGEDVGSIPVIVLPGSGVENSIHPGVLYQTGLFTFSDEILYLFNKSHAGLKKPLLLFNMMLTDSNSPESRDADRISIDVDKEETYNVRKTLQVLKYAVELGVTVVACQKVVHPLLSVFLRRNGVLLLERMGTELTCYVEKLSSATPISDIDKCTSREQLVPFLGHINTIRNVQCGKRRYISLDREGSNMATLLLGGINEEASEELKVTVEQALQSLRLILAEPFVLPGGGCFEMSLVAALHARVTTRAAADYGLTHTLGCLRWLQMSVLSAAGFDNSTLTSVHADTRFYHAWERNDGDDWSTCRCGLLTSDVIRAVDKTWVNLDLNATQLLTDCQVTSGSLVFNVDEKTVLDLYSSKWNALKLSLESYITLSGIGMVVCKSVK